jgi:hypothetical protein
VVTTRERLLSAVEELSRSFDVEMLREAPGQGLVRVRTGVQYLDGDLVDVFIREDSGTRNLRLTDSGDVMDQLWVTSKGGRVSEDERGMVKDVCSQHGIFYLAHELQMALSDELPSTAVQRFALVIAEAHRKVEEYRNRS